MNCRPTSRRSTSLRLAAVIGALAVGCDSAPAELVDEINAAREGCTEEMLKQGDEVCVQMFEKYADMGADAMETYIGGMRAFDEAVQRRGGMQFDTAGLGRAFSTRIAESVGQSGGTAGAYVRDPEVGTGSGETAAWPAGEPAGRWSDVPQETALEWAAPAISASSRMAPATTRGPAGRGTLLPPEERLRRPWLDDESGDAPPPEDDPDRSTGRERPLPEAGGWNAAPGAGNAGSGWGGDPRGGTIGSGWGQDPYRDPANSGWGADPRNDRYQGRWE